MKNDSTLGEGENWNVNTSSVQTDSSGPTGNAYQLQQSGLGLPYGERMTGEPALRIANSHADGPTGITPLGLSTATMLGTYSAYYINENPIVKDDEYGNVFAIWEECGGSCTGGQTGNYEYAVYADVYCQQASGTYCTGKATTQWEGATELSTTSYDLGPYTCMNGHTAGCYYGDADIDLAVTQTGEPCVSYAQQATGAFYIDCYLSGAWTGDNAVWLTNYYLLWPAIAWDSGGSLDVAWWYSNYYVSTNWYLNLTKFTITSSFSGWSHTLEADPLYSTLGYYSTTYLDTPYLDLACETSGSECSVFTTGATSATVWAIEVYSSSADFASGNSGPYTVQSVTWATGDWNSGQGASMQIGPGTAAYSTTSANGALVFQYVSTPSTTPSYTIEYAYSSNGWTSAGSVGAVPSAVAASGLGSPTVTIEGASAPFITWCSGSTKYAYVAGANYQNPTAGEWADYTLTTTGEGTDLWCAGAAVTSNSALGNSIPWRADTVYATSADAYYAYFEGPTITAPTSTLTSMDAYQSTTIATTDYAAIASGFGISSTYTWANLPPGCPSTSISFSCTPTSPPSNPTAYGVTVYATDLGGFTSPTMDSLTITLYIDPTVSGISPSKASGGIDAYQTVTWTATISSTGSGITTYTWSQSSGSFGCSGSTTTDTCTPTAGGTYTVGLILEDSNGCYSGGSSTCAGPGTAFSSASFTVYSDPVVSGFSASPTSGGIDVSQSTTWTPTYSSTGSGITTFTWTESSVSFGCADSGATNACTPTAAGSFTVSLIVEDSNSCYSGTAGSCSSPGTKVTSSSFTVYTDPSFSSLSPSIASGSIEAGQSVTFTATPTGGTGTYQDWSWTSLPSGCSSSSTGTETCTPSMGGVYTITVQNEDTNNYGPVSTSISGYIVMPAGSEIPSVRSAMMPASPAEVGQAVAFNTTATGGTGVYELYSWSESNIDLGCVLANSPIISCSPVMSGTYTVSINVTDSDGRVSHTETSSGFTVNAPLAAGTVSTSSATIDSGQSITLSAGSPSEGTPTYTFQWLSGSFATCSDDILVSGQTTTTYSPSPTTSTYYCVEYGDSSSGTPAAVAYSNTELVTVYPTLTANSITMSFPTIDYGQSITLTSNPAGGTSTYFYQWYSSSSNSGPCTSGTVGGTTPTNSVSPSTSTYYCYYLTDSSSGTPTASASSGWDLVTVNPVLAAGILTPGAPSIDLGQSIALTSSSPSGGTPSYAYQWLSGTSATCWDDTPAYGQTSTTYSPSPTTATYYCVEYKDSSSGTPTSVVYSNVVLVTVNSPLAANPVTTASPVIDAGQAITLTANPAGGTSPYSYQWYSSFSSSGTCTSGTPGGKSSTDSISPSLTTYYCYYVTDSSSGAAMAGASSAWDFVTVNPALVAGILTPATPAIDLGQSIALTSSSPYGGTPWYTYQWMSGSSSTCSGDAAVPGQATSSYSPSPTSSTYYCVEYGDGSSGMPATLEYSNAVLVTVHAPLTASTPTPNTLSIDLGQTMEMTSEATGGTPSYSFQWYEPLSMGTCSASSLAIPGATSSTYTAPSSLAIGIYYFCYAVTDSSAAGVVTAYSLTSMVEVSSDPVLSSIQETSPISCSVSCVADGLQTLSVSTTASLGSGDYSFNWAVTSGESACSGSSSGALTSTYSCTVASVTSTQTWTITVFLTDSNGCSYPSSCAGGYALSFTVTLYRDPTLSPVVETSPVSCSSACSADQGQTLSLQTTVSGGSGGFAFSWSLGTGSNAYCSGSASGTTTSTYSCMVGAITSTQTWTIAASVADSAGCTYPSPCARSTLSFSVLLYPDPSVTITASPVSGHLVAGQPALFTATPAGGSGSYTGWSWTALPAGCTDSGSSVERCYPSTGGTYTVSVEVKDSSNYGPVTDIMSYVVEPAASTPAVSVPISTPLTGVVGQTVVFNTTASGGSGIYPVFAWTESSTDLGCALANSLTISCEPLMSGTYTVSVSVTDSNGVVSQVRTSTDFAVQPNPAYPQVGLASSASTVSVGTQVTLTAAISGGASPYAIDWFLNGAEIVGATGSTYSFTPTATGDYNFQVIVTDLSGAKVASPAILVGVTAAGSSPITIAGISLEWVLAICTAILIVAVLLAVLWRRRSTNVPETSPSKGDTEDSSNDSSSDAEGSADAKVKGNSK